MRLVDKQVMLELVGPFIFGVTAFSSVFFAGTYLLKLTNWVMSGMPLVTAIWIVLLLLPSIVVYTLPMATLLAVLLGIGRLSGDSEIVALYASGVSLYRLAAPIIVLGVVVSGSSIALNELVSPKAFARSQELQAQILKQTAPTSQPFTVRDDSTNSLILVKGGMDINSGVLRNVTVTQFAGDKPLAIIYASRAVWAGVTDQSKKYRWKLYDGWSQLVGTDSGVIQTFSEFQTKEVDIGQGPKQFSLYQKSLTRDSDKLSFSELSQLVAYLKAHPDRPQDQIRQLEVFKWNRLALPISSLVFAMLAAPLGIRPYRSGSSVGFGLSILLIFLYWMVWHYTSSLAIQGHVSPFVGAFFADVLGIVAALALVRRAAK
ncbi:MAG: LptF/LptG family permease [Armatimonadetes bacterium]|nr:LptF/LptG family permease [Armatimonadota bacterium]